MKTFLYPTIKHASLRALARAKRCQSSLDDQDALEQIPAPDSVQGDGSLADKTSLEQLRFVLGRLPKKQTEVLWLRYVDGLDLEEIAAAIEVPVGTVKSRLHYAEQALRQVRGIRDLLG